MTKDYTSSDTTSLGIDFALPAMFEGLLVLQMVSRAKFVVDLIVVASATLLVIGVHFVIPWELGGDSSSSYGNNCGDGVTKMEISLYILLVIIGTAVVTFVPRVLPLIVLSRLDLLEWALRWLDYIPIAVMSALLAQEVLFYEDELA